MGELTFNLLAWFTLLSAAGVVINRNAVNAALCLLLCLTGVAGLFVVLEAYLLAFVLLLVYAGAVVALFLFIVMLLDTSGAPRALPRRLPLIARVLAGGLVASGVLSFSARVKLPVSEAVAAATGVGGALKPYAYQLFTTYLLPVQILGFLLLAAMLGVIVLSKKFEGLEDIK